MPLWQVSDHMPETPLVSIITPVYNHEKFIQKCLESVIAQTYASWEIIIVDDGSTDHTWDIVRSYCEPRIRYIRQENKGIEHLAETYNKALSMARGELIAILEGDDWWPVDKLQLQVHDFVDEDVVLSFGYTQEVDEQGKAIKLIPSQKLPDDALYNLPVGRASRYLMDMGVLTYLFPVSVVIRRSTLVSIGGFQQLPHLAIVDYPTFIQLSRLGKFAFHGEILGFWRRHSESTTRKKYYLINEGVYRYLTAFQHAYGKNLPIPAEELQIINGEWREYKWHQWFTLGRWFLADGEWRQARRAFSRCRSYAFNWKHPALLQFCVLSAAFHLNIEWLIDLLHLKTLDICLQEFNRDDIAINKSMIDEIQI